MGVLTTRLHGSITAIAAMATVSASTELPDKSFLKSFFNATGQTLLLSSVYAPAASSSFDFDLPLSPSSKPAMATSAASSLSPFWPANVPPILHVLPASVGVHSPFAFHQSSPFVQSASIRFYRATPRCDKANFFPPGTTSSRWLRYSVCECHPLFSSVRSPAISSLSHICSEGRRHTSAWRCPYAASYVFPLKPLFGRASFPGLSQTYRFERIIAFLYNSYAFPPEVSTNLLHTWQAHTVDLDASQPTDNGVKAKPTVAVVLLGWLGAQQKHLKRYADWYISRGIHAVTFVVPMKDLLTFKVGGKAEAHVDILTQHLTQWLAEDNKQGNEKVVIFHTFSNTGWLTYGAVLERLIRQGDEYLGRIKGCIVDSAPSARPDPQVWASGFSAALLKKSSAAAQKLHFGADSADGKVITQPQTSLKETALHAMLEKFFSVFLQMPNVNRRLNDVTLVLSKQQPSCPQLYIYSSADTVIPAKSVEAFVEEQRKAGRTVTACNFQHSPHVDHFRTFPKKYSDQLTSFLKLCIPQLTSVMST